MVQLFRAIGKQNGTFWNKKQGWEIVTQLEFPRNWGLGTSSTLVANLAHWAAVDPYKLLKDSFGGSGYDIACATAAGPIFYQIGPKVQQANFDPAFKEALYFVYLGKKQDSRKGIARYREKSSSKIHLQRISAISKEMEEVQELSGFEALIEEHEALVAETIELPRAKDLYFKDYPGQIKSLGAWGGDFVLATSSTAAKDTIAYFNEKGFDTVLPYKALIK